MAYGCSVALWPILRYLFSCLLPSVCSLSLFCIDRTRVACWATSVACTMVFVCVGGGGSGESAAQRQQSSLAVLAAIEGKEAIVTACRMSIREVQRCCVRWS